MGSTICSSNCVNCEQVYEQKEGIYRATKNGYWSIYINMVATNLVEIRKLNIIKTYDLIFEKRMLTKLALMSN